jgi:hypothetical protein
MLAGSFAKSTLLHLHEFKIKNKQFSRKGAKLAKRGKYLGFKPGFKAFLCALRGLCERPLLIFDLCFNNLSI